VCGFHPEGLVKGRFGCDACEPDSKLGKVFIVGRRTVRKNLAQIAAEVGSRRDSQPVGE
jgi:hypothetical protein